MPVKLYYTAASPPARAVLLTLKTLNIPHELRNVDLLNREHRTEEFVKLNPQHTVPVIEDEDGFVVTDSHAINSYLVGKYGKDDKLYPKDLKVRSVVDHRLHFDTGVLFQAVRTVAKSYFFDKTITGMNQKLVDLFEDSYGILDKYAAAGQYIAGNQVTIADFSVVTTLANMQIFVPVKKDRFPNLAAYIERTNVNIPFNEDLNQVGLKNLKMYFKDFNFEVSD